METYESHNRINDILTRARSRVIRSAPVAHSRQEIEQELYRRRKNYLGSDIPLKYLLETNGVVEDRDIDALAHYLSEQTQQFWNRKDAEAKDFCYRFYRLSMFALRYGNIRECVDDIFQLCQAMLRSREVFRYAEEDLLPPKMFCELYEFLDDADDTYFTPHFEDAVLFAIASLLGALDEAGRDTELNESEG